MLHKGNTRCLKNITDWEQSSLGTGSRRVESSRSEAIAPPRPWPQASTDFAKHVPGFREGTVFFPCISGPRGKGTKAPSQAITGECAFSIHQGNTGKPLSWSVQPSTGMACCSVLKASQCGWQSDMMDLIQPEAKRGAVTWPETGVKVWVSRDHDEGWGQSNYGTDMTDAAECCVGWGSWRDHR